MVIDARKLWEQAKANGEKRRACPRHRFERMTDRRLGQRHTCLNCGCEMRGPEVMFYIEGYEAAGGSADDIWPGYREVREAP